jgi:hypothetical protein
MECEFVHALPGRVRLRVMEPAILDGRSMPTTTNHVDVLSVSGSWRGRAIEGAHEDGDVPGCRGRDRRNADFSEL